MVKMDDTKWTIVGVDPGMLPGREVVQRLRHSICKILDRYSFKAPMRIGFKCELIELTRDDEIKIKVSLETVDRESRAPLPVWSRKWISVARLLEEEHLGEFESFIRDTVEGMAERLWMHEFHEWLRFDGQLVQDPHKGE